LQFFGVYQRQTGALTYISLAILLLSSSLASGKEFIKKFMRVVLIIGALLILYGNIQYLGLEPFPYVNAYTVNAPIGTFGNSDFQSAFMGLIALSPLQWR
jgi:type IV secretory pathway TrbL component